jgi:hypothetical protein
MRRVGDGQRAETEHLDDASEADHQPNQHQHHHAGRQPVGLVGGEFLEKPQTIALLVISSATPTLVI